MRRNIQIYDYSLETTNYERLHLSEHTNGTGTGFILKKKKGVNYNTGRLLLICLAVIYFFNPVEIYHYSKSLLSYYL
jgi:hypothetical protein